MDIPGSEINNKYQLPASAAKTPEVFLFCIEASEGRLPIPKSVPNFKIDSNQAKHRFTREQAARLIAHARGIQRLRLSRVEAAPLTFWAVMPDLLILRLHLCPCF